MRHLALLLLFNGALSAQSSSLMLGISAKTSMPSLATAKEFDLTYRTDKYEALANFQNQTAWTLAFRVYIGKYFFLQEAVRDNRITQSGLHPRQALHPWVLQSGAGLNVRPFRRELLTFTASPSQRLKTVQSGYVLAVNSFFNCGHNITWHASYVRSRLLAESNQIGAGFEYVFHFR